MPTNYKLSKKKNRMRIIINLKRDLYKKAEKI